MCIIILLPLLNWCHTQNNQGQLTKRNTPYAPATSSIPTYSLYDEFTNAAYFWEQQKVAQQIAASGDISLIPKLRDYIGVMVDRRRICNAGLALAGLGDERGIAVIIQELNDANPANPRFIEDERSDGQPDMQGQITSDRYYAALLLGEIGDRKAVPDLIAATEDPGINYIAAISLGQIGDPAAIPALRAMLSLSPRERLWTGYGLALLGAEDGFDILTEVALSDSTWTERRHAVEAMGNIGDPRMTPVLVKALKDNHVNVRVSAARSLGMIGDTNALPALYEALEDHEQAEVNAPTTVDSEAQKAIELIRNKLD